MQAYQEITLSRISSNPNNPRKNFLGPRFDELVASIQEKGVIEPIIIRPISDKGKEYEVVAGERRFKASCLIAENEKGLDYYKIPAVLRELTDDEAFDFMIIENLQREDLTAFEEAQSFKQYFEKKGKGSIPELAIRIGKNAGYIRRKIAVLSLPNNIVKAWEKEEISFSHLEQLRRLKSKEELNDAFDFATGGRFRRGPPASKRDLKEHIDNMAPPLENALFNIKEEGCTTCDQNSDVQQKLWDIGGMKGAHCLDKRCFKQKQNNFLQANWKQSKYRKRHGTNGFRFLEDVKWNDFNNFEYGPKPIQKCKECANFLTLINLDGKIETGQVCFGDDSCFEATRRERSRKEREKEKEKKIKKGEPEGPRVSWHGVFFRERFLEKRIPEKFKEFQPSNVKMARLTLFSFLRSNSDLLPWFCKKIKIHKARDGYYSFYHMSDKRLFKPILEMNLDQVLELLKEATLKAMLQPSTINPEGRLLAAEHLGIDLAKEWSVTEEYLQKKTIKEMLEFGEKSRIFKDKKVQGYLTETLKKKPGKYSSCKKTELISIFLKSGVDLVGKVPDEIIQKEK